MPNLIERARDLFVPTQVREAKRMVNDLLEIMDARPTPMSPESFIVKLKEMDPMLLDFMMRQFREGGYAEPNESMRLQAVQESRNLYLWDVVSAAIIGIWTDYGFGVHLNIVPRDEDADKIWSEFWTADVNQAILNDRDLSTLSDTLLVEGEFYFVFFVSRLDGTCTIRTVPTDQIKEIVTDPDDASVPLFYRREYAGTDTDSASKNAYYPDWRATDAQLEAAKLPTDAVRADRLKADLNTGTDVLMMQVAHHKRNSRGWPLMTAGAAWSRAYKNFLQDRAAVSKAVAAYVDKIIAKTGSRGIADLKNRLQSSLNMGSSGIETNPAPVAGSTWLENEAATRERLPLATGAGDAEKDGAPLLAQAGLAGRIYPHYLGRGEAFRLATACYSDDTEYLGEHGWKKWQDWNGEKIATYNHEAKRLDYLEPTKLHTYDYQGKMIHLHGRGVDALVTPNHRMLVLNENNISKPWAHKGYEVLQADSLPSRFALPASASVDWPETPAFLLPGYQGENGHQASFPDRLIEIDDWLRFIGAYISEGSLYQREGHYSVEISQASNSPHLESMREAVSRMPVDFSESVDDSRENPKIRWRTSDRALYVWLLENCEKGSGSIHLPAFCLALNVRQSKILLDALWDGDGHWENCEHYKGFYTSISHRLVDEVQMLIINSGDWGGIAVNRPENGHKLFEKSAACFVVYRNTYKKRSLARRKSVEEVDYTGKVWCFEAPPNKMFVTRHNGQPLIAGNTAMEGPTLRAFNRYQLFWSSVWADLVKLVLKAAEEYGNKKFSDYTADINTDSILQMDFNTIAPATKQLLDLQGIGAVSNAVTVNVAEHLMKAALTTMGIKDADALFEAPKGEEELYKAPLLKQEKPPTKPTATATNPPGTTPPGGGTDTLPSLQPADTLTDPLAHAGEAGPLTIFPDGSVSFWEFALSEEAQKLGLKITGGDNGHGAG